MKRIGLLVLLVVLAAGSVWGQDVYKWDFEDNEQSKDWQAINGNWIIENGVYKQKSNEKAAHILAGTNNWDNYTVETKIRIDEGKWAGLIFRAQNQLEYYVFYLNIPDNKTEFWRHNKGDNFEVRDVLQHDIPVVGSIQFKSSEWYKFRIDVSIDDFTFYIDDIKQGVFQDTNRKYINGGIGLWAWETKVSFDDVVVRSGVPIPDLNLRTALEKALGKNEGDAITKEDLTGLKELNAEGLNITDISVLKYTTSLAQLNLEDNQITDISPLLENTEISGKINLKNNPLSNTALSTHIPALIEKGIQVEYDKPEGLILFKDANLEKAIRDALGIPIELLKKEDLEKLEELDVQQVKLPDSKKIRDLSGLEYCQNLEKLVVTGTLISDLTPLANSKKLTVLVVSDKISDVSPLANLTNLKHLGIYDNQISDISALAGLTKLTKLDFGLNEISDISVLANLTNLTELELERNPVNNISVLANLVNLSRLQLGRTQSNNISALANLTNLSLLRLFGNEIVDLSPLTNLTNLLSLRLSENQIIDIKPLIENTGIAGRIYLKNNPLNNIALTSYIPALKARGITA
ncbi:hypothetical protein CMK12_11620 [Candidatus Poribacteria bacterium]|nr:hypothetical protein [Candidatus Poribacteria bacterium]MDP6594742.1 leucine-rich repeat domain-containing protein [Candidatus Poribacteria bacterium]MDP6960725.1 leucine-rich repeat domain-containing protein [Dehalococcoidia bacterium]